MPTSQSTGHRDFFISRAGEDKDVAVLIDQILRDADHTTFIQDRDFGHTSFMERMSEGFRMVEGGSRLIALLSRKYQEKDHCRTEAHYPLIDDPDNTKERLIVFRIEECAPIGFLKSIPFVDLVPLLNDAEQLARVVRDAVAREKNTPEVNFAALYRRSPKQILHPEVRAVPGFTSRGAELSALDEILWRKSGRAALTGLGGVGKSVLAQEYAWRNRERYHGAWWVRAETRETLLDDLIELGSHFIPALKEEPDRIQAAQIALDHIAQTQTSKPWLIVYDYVVKPSDINRRTPTDNAHVLITTRWSDWYEQAEELPVDVFPRDTAIDYLLARARSDNRQTAERLADDLGCLPLALNHARSYCWATNWSFDKYRERLTELIRKAPRDAHYPLPVFATFELALEKAVAHSPKADLLMRIIAYLAPDRIPLEIITEDVMSDIELGEAVAALSEVSLLTRETLDDDSKGVSVHRLVQHVVRGRLGDEEAKSAAELATRLIANTYPGEPGDVHVWPACHRLESHVLAVLETTSDRDENAEWTSLLLNRYAVHLQARADYAAAESLYRRALKISEASYGPDHPIVATDLNNLASLLRGTNRYAEAELLIRRALEINEASLGLDHPDVATDLNNLAALFWETNRYVDAEPLYRRALEINVASLGPDHPVVAMNLNNLAMLLKDTNRYAEAELLIRRAPATMRAA